MTFDKTPSTGLARIVQEDHYYPFGMKMPGLSYDNASGNKFLFNGKELQTELGMYDFGARFYEPTLGRWHSVDPLAEKYYDFSPYVGLGNNPVRYVDPDGRVLDDYTVDPDGYIKLDKKTDDFTDKLKAVDSKGNKTGAEMTIHKGVLNNIQHSKEFGGYDFMYVPTDKDATRLFEFVAKNTKVEWTQIKYGEPSGNISSNYISTSHETDEENGSKGILFDFAQTNTVVREHIHSHPNAPWPGPSGFNPKEVYYKQGDNLVADWMKKEFPDTKLKVYDVKSRTYVNYNEKGAVKK